MSATIEGEDPEEFRPVQPYRVIDRSRKMEDVLLDYVMGGNFPEYIIVNHYSINTSYPALKVNPTDADQLYWATIRRRDDYLIQEGRRSDAPIFRIAAEDRGLYEYLYDKFLFPSVFPLILALNEDAFSKMNAIIDKIKTSRRPFHPSYRPIIQAYARQFQLISEELAWLRTQK